MNSKFVHAFWMMILKRFLCTERTALNSDLLSLSLSSILLHTYFTVAIYSYMWGGGAPYIKTFINYLSLFTRLSLL